MKKTLFVLVLVLVPAAFLGSCSKEQSATVENAEALAGQVGDWSITRDRVQELFDQLPPADRARFDTPAGRAELVDRQLQDELWYIQGIEENLANDPEVLEKLENAKRTLVIKAYFEKYVEPRVHPTEEEMHDFYEENIDAFKKKAIRRAQHIFSKNPDKLVDFKKRIEKGEPMTTLAHKYSEDQLTKSDGGDLGYFNPGGYIRGAGFSQELSDAVFSLPLNVVSDPVKWKKGYSIVRVNEIRPEELKTFEEVRDEIRSIITSRRIDEEKRVVFRQLMDAHGGRNYLGEELSLVLRTPEELWNLAQTSTDSFQRIRHYSDIHEQYPHSSYAPMALFMIGFVYAEELQDKVEADRYFNKVLYEYPDSDVAKSAEWMIDNLDKPLPSFDDLEDLSDKIGG